MDLDDAPTKRASSPKRHTGFSRRPGGRRKSDRDDREDEILDSGDDEEVEEEEWVPDVFVFEYGTVVIWGMTGKEEKAFLKSL